VLVRDISPETLLAHDPKKLISPLHGALIKNEEDVHLLERLAFTARKTAADAAYAWRGVKGADIAAPRAAAQAIRLTVRLTLPLLLR
jgi:hypothetical protein